MKVLNFWRQRLFCIFSVTALLVSSSPATWAHGTSTDKSSRQIDEHHQTDFGFPGFSQLNKQLQRDFETFNFAAATTAYQNSLAMAPAANSHIVGQWSQVLGLPIVAIHNAVLPTGKVLMWDSVGDNPTETYPVHNTTRAIVWDPATGISTRYDVNTGFNLFCAGHAALPDGRQFIAGGNLNQYLDGLNALHTFNPFSLSWNYLGPMTQGGRWYPSVTETSTGEMLITSGGIDTPEIFNSATGLRPLTSASMAMPLYPWLMSAPNGETLYFGPGNGLSTLNTSATGSWRSISRRDGINRDYGSFASYDIGKILVSGGGPAVKSTVVIDNLNGSAKVTQAGDLITGRRQHNLTVLPNGTVLATGGISNDAPLVDLNAGVYTAELWNPATGIWQNLSSMQRPRQYHSMALLLPDGRVLVGGGGICGACQTAGYLEKNIEIFSPPYLFNTDGSGTLAPRPSINSAPSTIGYRQSFNIGTNAPRSIREIVLMRPAAVTHSVNFEQRRIPLRFTNSKRNGLQATAPTDGSVAPPGYYMLFVIDESGVPSVATMVKLG